MLPLPYQASWAYIKRSKRFGSVERGADLYIRSILDRARTRNGNIAPVGSPRGAENQTLECVRALVTRKHGVMEIWVGTWMDTL